MTDCDYEDCPKDAVGTVVWTEDELPREYCQVHIQQSKAEYPEIVKRVELA